MLEMINLDNGLEPNLEILKRAITNQGAFYLKSSNINLTDEMVFSSASSLFSVPESCRKTVKKEGFLRGYIGYGKESGSAAFEVKEGFSCGYYHESNSNNPNGNVLTGENVWPIGFLDRDRAILRDFLKHCQQITKTLTEMLSMIFAHSKTAWPDLCKEDGEKISIMRIFHYFCAREQQDLGSSQHTDWGFLTIIKAKEIIPGLQVAKQDQDDPGKIYWTDIPAIPPGETTSEGWFIVNGGDFLSIMTKGHCLSPLHRVISTAKERTSLVYFAYPTYTSSIPSFHSPLLSIYQDQNGNGENIGLRQHDTEKLKEYKCFGDFINSKWASVGRGY
jgi:isopenicillin N synthase-like dioxygenase